MIGRTHNGRRAGTSRQGLAATEFAICLPVIVLIVMAMIETCGMVFLKQSLTIAAYEGAHTALMPNATAGDVRNTCNQILSDRRVRDATITLVPADPARVPEGEFLEVRISAPADSNNMVPGRFFGGRIMRAAAVMMKEI